MKGLPWWLSGKESACQCRRCERLGFDPWVRKILWKRKWQPTLVSCLENSLDRGAWWATAYGVAKSQTRLSTYHYHKLVSIILCATVFISLWYLPRRGIAGSFECRKIDVFELWCWRRLESPLDCKEIQPVPPRGDESWVLIGRTDAEAETPILWPLHEKS